MIKIISAVLLLCAGLSLPAGAADPRLQWKKEWGPMVPHNKFPKDCSLCHVPKRWDVLRPDFAFDHKKETGYPLIGAHAQAACLRCHNDRGAVKAYLARGCAGCHVDAHKGTLGLDCERCHDQRAWVATGRQGAKIADHARTRFPLTGMHAVIDCRQCHLGAERGDFKAMPTDCRSCHAREYASAPNHASRGYSQDCKSCHRTSAWPGASFNHAALGPNPNCVSCHAPDFARAPNHVAQGFSNACLTCHTGTTAWAGARFDHAPLGPNPACINCHAANYASAPNHAAQGFATTCLSCHTGTTTWLGAVFDHAPLGPNPTCVNCHAANYAAANATPASKHAANAFPQTCQNCHNTTAWGPGTPMQHAFVPNSCATCHTANFNAAVSPVNHVAQGIFASACVTCHTGYAAWNPASFVHNPSNCYSSGSGRAHQNARCVQCHASPTYTTSSCTACHENRGLSCN